MKHTLIGWLVFFSLAISVALFATGAQADAPTGNSPLDPLMVPTDWMTIAPNSSLWFYFDYWLEPVSPLFRKASARAPVNVIVEAQGARAIRFAIYTPTQAQEWLRDSTTPPVGRGTPYRNPSTGDIVHDLYWSGAFNTGGRYFIRVTNDASVALPFRLTVQGDTVALYPTPTPTPTPTLPFPVTRVPTDTIPGKIVFQQATGGVIYTVNGDGSRLTPITTGLDPTWSPDGKRIAFARWGAVYPGLYIVNADGTNEQLIYGAPNIRSPRWSPDGRFIAFTQQKTGTSGQTLWKLGVVELPHVKPGTDEWVPAKLTEPQCGKLCYVPSWNNDSQTLAYVEPGTGIFATKIEGGAPWRILAPSGSYWDTRENIPRPILYLPPIQSAHWSPDGTRMVYAQQAHDRWDLNIVDVNTQSARAITTPDPILYTLFHVIVNNVSPVWSPDSQQILFLSDRNGKWEFFVVNADGSNPRQVLKNVTDLIPLRFDFENERMMDWTR